MSAKVSDLIGEMTTVISGIPDFVDKSFSIHNVEEIERMSLVGYPLVAIAYEGGEPVQGNSSADPKGRGSHGAALYTATFTVILAVEYVNALSGNDTKVDALDLMDSIKQALIGYKGVNSRPWIFKGESPMDGVLEGVIFYGQIWQTDISVVGNSQHP